MNEYFSKIYTFFTVQRRNIINIFKLFYLLLVIFVITAQMFFRNNNSVLFIYEVGTVFGKLSLLAYVLTLLPGIGERLGLGNKALSILRIYRRYIGILVFFLSIVHIYLVKVYFASSLKDFFPQGTFEIMGMISFVIISLLTSISNNISMSRLKIWWYRIQRLTYATIFFVFFHVALVKVSIWSLLMGLVLLIEIASFIAVYRKTHSLTGGKPV